MNTKFINNTLPTLIKDLNITPLMRLLPLNINGTLLPYVVFWMLL
jgi:hypothetical protein